MQYNFVLALAALAPVVVAHGKISVVQGDAGGNGTALAIQGGIVPGAGSNSVTEVDTTVFRSTRIATNGLGRTTGSGRNTVSMVAQSMALSGNTLPQVSANGGSISGTLHIVTTDGAGPFKAIVDPTGTGKFKKGVLADVAEQVPGKNGNIHRDGTVASRSIIGRALVKRAANVNKDFPFKINIPAGTTCTGSMAGLENVCLLKVANSNPAGPFGGVVAFQMAGAGSTGASTTDSTSKEASGCSTAAAKRDAVAYADEDDFEIPEEDDN